MRRQKVFSGLLLTGCVLVSACQVTSGTLVKLDRTCKEIPKFSSSMNWEVWGNAKKIENCSGGRSEYERYGLENGTVSYQATYEQDAIFSEMSERVFREALSSSPSFRDNWKSVPIREVRTQSRTVLYSIVRGSGDKSQCAYFHMGLGDRYVGDIEDGWKQVAQGGVCSETTDRDEFAKAFEERIHAFDNRQRQGVKNDAGFESW